MPRAVPVVLCLLAATCWGRAGEAQSGDTFAVWMDASRVAAETDVDVLEARLRHLQRTLSEERAYSTTDSRRARLAKRLLALDSTNALAHEERALARFLEYDWRRSIAERQGRWNADGTRGMSGGANRALRRSRAHLDRALRTDPGRISTHRLRLRTYVTAGDDAGLLRAARAFVEARPSHPDAQLFLALAQYRNGETVAAAVGFDEALAAMPDSQRAAIEDVGRFVRGTELAAFEADSVAFAARFWERRDPRLLTDHNERRTEHLARFALADLLFTDTQTGRGGWRSTQGEVTVRYGLPGSQRTWLENNPRAKDFSRMNRWDYGDFALLFEDAFRTGDYEFWSSAKGEDEVIRARSLMNTIPERFEFEPAGRVEVPVAVATFRGEGGATDLVVQYGVPVSDRDAQFDVEAGAFLLMEGRVVGEQRHLARTSPAAVEPYAETSLWSDGFALTASPGAYELAVEFDAPAASALGVERLDLVVPAYPDGIFALSDVLLATAVEEVGRPSPPPPGSVVRNGLALRPAPWAVFATQQPIYLYAEAYGLTPADDGYSRYAVEVALRPKPKGTAWARLGRALFGENPEGVAVEFEGSGRGAEVGDYVVLDASAQPPGPYELTLSLRDRVSGDVRTRRLDLLLE